MAEEGATPGFQPHLIDVLFHIRNLLEAHRLWTLSDHEHVGANLLSSSTLCATAAIFKDWAQDRSARKGRCNDIVSPVKRSINRRYVSGWNLIDYTLRSEALRLSQCFLPAALPRAALGPRRTPCRQHLWHSILSATSHLLDLSKGYAPKKMVSQRLPGERRP